MNCKNCNTTLNNTANFCSNCGGKVIRNRLTIKNLFAHFSEQFLNYDNKFLKTIIHLFTKPEVVIGGYINGTRKKYVNAISYFAIAVTLSGLQLFLINKFFPEAMDFSSWSQKETEKVNEQIVNITQEYQSIIMMFYIPFYAFFSKIVFYNYKQYNYTEHLLIFLYTQAQVSIIGFVFILLLLAFNIPMMVVSFIQLFLMFIYIAFVLKRMHNLTFLEIFIKTLIFILIFGAIVMLPIIAYGFYIAMQQAV